MEKNGHVVFFSLGFFSIYPTKKKGEKKKKKKKISMHSSFEPEIVEMLNFGSCYFYRVEHFLFFFFLLVLG